MKNTIKLAAATLALLFSAGSWALPILGLFNTGVDGSGNALVGGDGISDPHYSVFSSDIFGVTTGVNAVTYFNGAYVSNTSTSRWISHSATGFPGSGTTVFRTTFDLTGLDPASATISGLNSADNGGSIFLNGVDTGIDLNGNFTVLVPFNISTGFNAGLNFLDFAITDFGPPLAFHIAGISGTANAANGNGRVTVPAPASVTLVGLGLFGIAALRRKHQRT